MDSDLVVGDNTNNGWKVRNRQSQKILPVFREGARRAEGLKLHKN
jgi:hypothetical protein